MASWKKALAAILSVVGVLSLWLCVTQRAALRADFTAEDDAAPVVRVWQAWRADGAAFGAPQDWLGKAAALSEGPSDGSAWLFAPMPAAGASKATPSASPPDVEAYVRVSLRHLAVAMVLLGLLGVGAAVLLIEHALLARIHALGRELTRSAGAGDLIRFP